MRPVRLSPWILGGWWRGEDVIWRYRLFQKAELLLYLFLNEEERRADRQKRRQEKRKKRRLPRGQVAGVGASRVDGTALEASPQPQKSEEEIRAEKKRMVANALHNSKGGFSTSAQKKAAKRDRKKHKVKRGVGSLEPMLRTPSAVPLPRVSPVPFPVLFSAWIAWIARSTWALRDL